MKHKTHSNAWGEDLPEQTRWELYALTKPPTEAEREAGRAWLRDFRADVLPHLAATGLAAPGRSAWYRFLGRMREAEAAKAIISVETSKRIAQGIVRADVDARLAADMMTALSVDAASKGNDEAAKILADSAAKYHAAALGAKRLRLDAERQRTAEAKLRLDREKFEGEVARRTAAEARAERAESEAESLKARVAELEKALRDAGKATVADPAKVAAEVDRILGRGPRR